MNYIVIYSFFYLFLSGTILFTILGMFAGSGNPALLIENSLKDNNNKLIEEEGLRKRITIQYFIAAFLDLCFALIFLRFIFNLNKSASENVQKGQKNINNEPKKETIKKEEKKPIINPDIINNEEINTNSNKGMSEKDD